MCRVRVAPLMLLLLSIFVNIASAQIPARVETPYTLMDAQSRPNIEGGVEIPWRGNGLLTGYAYLFATRAHVLDEDLYLRLASRRADPAPSIPPG